MVEYAGGVPAEDEEAEMDLRRLLASVESAAPVDVVDVLAAELGRMVDATCVSLLMANFSGDAVVRMSHVEGSNAVHAGHKERTESLPLSGSAYEQVLFEQEPNIRRSADGWDVLVPVTERGDALAVLELTLPHSPDDEVVEYVEAAAHALAYVLISSRRHTDLFEWAQRDQTFSLSAEIQRRLLPSAYTIEGAQTTSAGWLEPAAEAGGDTFDVSLDREFLYASITDAMGHSIEAALLATLTVGSLRNARRSLATPSAQAATANEALLESSRTDQFVTGLVMRIGLTDGRLEIVNAGHPSPFLLRRGEARVLELTPHPALGIVPCGYEAETVALEPGDRLLFVTDGFLERNAVEVDIPAILVGGQHRHPREVVRELAANVLSETGRNLQDDATVLCIEWNGPGTTREATAGADRDRATH